MVHRIRHIAVVADGWRKTLVLLRVSRLPYFVEYEPYATSALRDIALAKFKDFSAEMVGGVAKHSIMKCLGRTILHVLREVLFLNLLCREGKVGVIPFVTHNGMSLICALWISFIENLCLVSCG